MRQRRQPVHRRRSDWIDGVREYAKTQVSEKQMAHAAKRFPYNTPINEEAYLFRRIFESHFPLASAAECVPGGPTVACSTPEAVLWDASLQKMNDPSGRAVSAGHQDAY